MIPRFCPATQVLDVPLPVSTAMLMMSSGVAIGLTSKEDSVRGARGRDVKSSRTKPQASE
jgi:hypothetical protein